MVAQSPLDVANDLLDFIGSGPSPFHAVAESARRLTSAGFDAVDHKSSWTTVPSKGFVAVDSALVAWHRPDSNALSSPVRLIGAHTDSPNLRIRPQPDTGRAGWRQLGVEVYGGALVNSWLDRDLGLAGRVSVRGANRLESRLLRIDRPLLRVPQLAIHLDRDISERGLQLNRQQHLTPVWGLGDPALGGFATFIGDELGLQAAEILAWDLMAFDLNPGVLAGAESEFVSAARLDNLCSCFVAVNSLIGRSGDSGTTGIISLFDHEEVGSNSARGASGEFLAQILERLTLASGGSRGDYLAALAGSACLSADMAHATHPNYPDRHEPEHQVALNAGPVVKINNNQRYATDAATQAGFELVCAEVGVPVQRFVARNDMGCGSTIGPDTAARLGIPTVDVGIAQLGMHSIRELCGSADPALFVRAATAWLG